jgi:hypothetical protein
MAKYKVTWEERHSTIIEANSYEEAQELAVELDSDGTTYECCIDQEIKKL